MTQLGVRKVRTQFYSPLLFVWSYYSYNEKHGCKIIKYYSNINYLKVECSFTIQQSQCQEWEWEWE